MATAIPPDALCFMCRKPGCDRSTPMYTAEDAFLKAMADRRGEPLEIHPCETVFFHAECDARGEAAFRAWVDADTAKRRAAGKVVIDMDTHS